MFKHEANTLLDSAAHAGPWATNQAPVIYQPLETSLPVHSKQITSLSRRKHNAVYLACDMVIRLSGKLPSKHVSGLRNGSFNTSLVLLNPAAPGASAESSLNPE